MSLAALSAACVGSTVATPARANSPALSIAIVGNHFVDGSGKTVRLLGVDRPGSEYACVDGYAYTPAQGDEAADAAAIAGWHANAVRIPLNEDCWLGLNGQPSGNGQSATGYRQAVEAYVDALHADGIYAILDLHWSAPGTVVANGQRSMPDDHSAAFWESVASTFIDDHAVVFDAFNEPIAEPGFPVSWSCWRDGGCTVPQAKDGDTPDAQSTYTAVGMQALVDAIRGTGATQPIMLGGLDYANDLTGWLANQPTDTLATPQLAASFHNYDGEACGTSSCWDSTIAGVAAQVPVVTGEFDEDDCPDSGDDPTNFDNEWMSWADAHGVSYLAWGWYVLPDATCSTFYLVTDADGSPAAPNGIAVHDHLTTLASESVTTAASPAPSPAPSTAASVTPAMATAPPAAAPPAAASPTAAPPKTTSAAPLRLRITQLSLTGRRLKVRTSQARSYSGHLELRLQLQHGHSRRTLTVRFLARVGCLVTLPKGFTILGVRVDHSAGGGFTQGSVTATPTMLRHLR